MKPNTLQIVPYEQRLDQNARWALSEGSRFFEERSAVQDALRKIASRLNDLGIPYAIVGGMALFHHGYRRFTEDVDLLVSRDNLKRIHEKLEGLGYLPPFANSKNLRDVDLGVKIEFLITGDYPGDGKPKPVSFPDPLSNAVELDGVRYIGLTSLIELKLASGISNPSRLKDLADVIELIKILNLPLDYAQGLNPYVQEKYKELWSSARRRYVLLWRKDNQNAQTSVDLEMMKNDGVFIDVSGKASEDYLYLVTTDLAIAKKYGMEDESEI